MRVRVAGLAQVVDVRGPEMDRLDAVTLPNDLCILAPGALVDRGPWRIQRFPSGAR